MWYHLPVGHNVSAGTWPPVTSFPGKTDGRGWSPEVLLERFYISPSERVLALPLSTHVLPHFRFTSDQGSQRQIFKALSDAMLLKVGCWAMPAATTNWLPRAQHMELQYSMAGSAGAAPSQSGQLSVFGYEWSSRTMLIIPVDQPDAYCFRLCFCSMAAYN